MQSARRCNSGTSRSSKNWNDRGRINGNRNRRSAASNSNWSKCSRSTLNRRNSCKNASSGKCRNSRIENLRAAVLQSTNNNNKPQGPDPSVRPSTQEQAQTVAGAARDKTNGPGRIPGLDQRSVLFAVFQQILQCAVPQFAEFTIQKMLAPEERQDGIAAVLHFAKGLSQSRTFTE